jgi:hypothetical protein
MQVTSALWGVRMYAFIPQMNPCSMCCVRMYAFIPQMNPCSMNSCLFVYARCCRLLHELLQQPGRHHLNQSLQSRERVSAHDGSAEAA